MVAIDADEERLRRIYDECYNRLLAYTLGYTNRSNAEEIVSEALLIAWRRLREVPAKELPWLIGVVRNLVRERYRADRRLQELCLELSTGMLVCDDNGGDIAEDVVERAAALRALADLGDADREALTLIAWHGLSNREAAEVLGCSTATFVVRVHRARRRLHAAMAPPGPAEARTPKLIDIPQEIS